MIEKYTYDAVVTSVHDGDTFTCDIDLGMSVWVRDQKVRLARLNAPELSTPEGPAYRDWLRDRLANHKVVLRTIKDKKEKYGRWLGEVWVEGVNVNDEILAKQKRDLEVTHP